MPQLMPAWFGLALLLCAPPYAALELQSASSSATRSAASVQPYCARAVPAGLLPAQVAVSAAPARAQDEWFAGDKVQHFWTSYATAAFAFAGFTAAGQSSDDALVAGLLVGAGAGVGKEIADYRRGGPFSVKDLVADGLGLAAAYFFLREVR